MSSGAGCSDHVKKMIGEDQPIEKITKDVEVARVILMLTTRTAAAIEGTSAFAELAGNLTGKYGPAVSAFINEKTNALQAEWVNAVSGMKHVLRLETHPLAPGGPDVRHINYEQQVPRGDKPGRFKQVQDVHLDTNGQPIP
jgi:hypothetical protein